MVKVNTFAYLDSPKGWVSCPVRSLRVVIPQDTPTLHRILRPRGWAVHALQAQKRRLLALLKLSHPERITLGGPVGTDHAENIDEAEDEVSL